MTFRKICEIYFKVYKCSVRNNSYKTKKSSFLFQSKELLDLEIKDLTVERITKHIELLSLTRVQNTVSYWVYFAKKIFNYAVEHRYIKDSENSFKKILKVKKTRTRVLNIVTELEFTKMINFVNQLKEKNMYRDLEEQKLFLTTLYRTGLRSAEARAIQINKINFNTGSLIVDKAIDCSVKGKWTLTQPKTRTSTRTIKLDKFLLDKLKEHIDKNKKNENDFLFSFSDGEPRNAEFAKPLLKNLAKLSGVKVSTHGLRHSHATMLIRSGVPINVVQKRLGHANPSITLNLYCHLDNKDEEMALKALEKIEI